MILSSLKMTSPSAHKGERQSSIVRQGAYADDWMCLCDDGPGRPPDFGDVEGRVGECGKKVRPGRTVGD